MDVVIVSSDEVPKRMPMGRCIDVIAASLTALHVGEAHMPLRFAYKMPLDEGRFGVLASMPSYMKKDGASYCANKVITVYPQNAKDGLHSHQGTIQLFEAEHGRLLAIVDAASVTAIRTAAASAVATRLLAREQVTTLCLIGSGVQAHTHLEAMRLVRPSIKTVRVYSRTADKAHAFAAAYAGLEGVSVTACASVEEAARDADVICTLTPATEPLLKREHVADGAHVNAVGACTPTMAELAAELVRDSRLYADARESCLNEPGDILRALRDGLITKEHIVADLGELLAGSAQGRASDSEITLFKSLGLAVEDLATALDIYKSSTDTDLRTKINP